MKKQPLAYPLGGALGAAVAMEVGNMLLHMPTGPGWLLLGISSFIGYRHADDIVEFFLPQPAMRENLIAAIEEHVPLRQEVAPGQPPLDQHPMAKIKRILGGSPPPLVQVVDADLPASPQPLARNVIPSLPVMPSKVVEEYQPKEGDIFLGHDRQGKPVYRSFKQLKGIYVSGLQGGGKTSTVLHLMWEAKKQGAFFVAIDKHAKCSEESLASKLGGLEDSLLCEVGGDPELAERAVDTAQMWLDARLNGASCDFWIIVVVDEFTATMKEMKYNGKWAKVAQKLVIFLDAVNMEGRKNKMAAICIGQTPNGESNGSAELRDLFNTFIVHRLREKPIRTLCLSEHKKEIMQLSKGEALFDMEDSEPFIVKVPYREQSSVPVREPRTEFGTENSVRGSELSSTSVLPVKQVVPSSGLGENDILLAKQFVPSSVQSVVPSVYSQSVPLENENLSMPSDLRATIAKFYRSGMKRKAIQRHLGLNGSEYSIIRDVCDDCDEQEEI